MEILPTELLVLTVGNLRDERDYLNLCLCSRALRAAAEEFLYEGFSNTGSPGRVGLLLRTITKHPRLCVYIKTMELQLFPGLPHPAPSNAEVLACIKSLARVDIRDTYFVNWLVQSLRVGSYDAGIALLLMLAKRVRRVELGISDWEGADSTVTYADGYCNGTSLVLAMLARCQSGQFTGVLAELELAIFGLAPERDRPRLVPLYTVAPLFTLPNIECFAGVRLATLNRGTRWTQMASSVSRLGLVKCRLDTTAIVTMIDACSALSTLIIEWQLDFPVNEVQSYIDLDFGEISRALEKHAPTLRNLTLDTFNDDWITITGTIRPLHNFKRLYKLHIDDGVIYGGDPGELWRWWRVIGDVTTVMNNTLPPDLKHLGLRTRRHFTLFPDILGAMAATTVVTTGELGAFDISFPVAAHRMNVMEWSTIAEMRAISAEQDANWGARLPYRTQFPVENVFGFEEILHTFPNQEYLGEVMLASSG